MASYEDLRAYFDEQGDLQEIAGRASRVHIVTGFLLDLDGLWALLHDIEQGWTASPEFERDLPRFIEWDDWISTFSSGYWNTPWWRWHLASGPYQGFRRRDLKYQSRFWEDIRRRWKDRFKRDRLPVIMTITHRPIGTPTSASDTLQDHDALRDLMGIVRESRVAVRVEERPVARFSLAVGDGISTAAGKSGTLGGVLFDVARGKSYGVTCAHVAATNDTITDAMGTPIGTCIADTQRSSLAVPLVCDPVNLPMPNPYPGNGPSVNMLDCALVDLATTTITTPQLGGIATGLSPGQGVTMKGAQSTIQCKLGSLAISYVFQENQQDFCFRDSIELLPQPSGPFGGALGRLTTTIPTQGDSGAWVLTTDPKPVWAGLFFGEDGQRGFAIRSSWVHNWAQAVTGAALSV